MANNLGLDLYDLWRAGKVHLPWVAMVYAEASRELHLTGWREAPIQSGALRLVMFRWRQIRDDLQRATAITAERLIDSSDALVEIANLYASIDETAAEQLRRSINEAAASPILPQPPTNIPTAKWPHDPHDTETLDISLDLPFGPDFNLSLEVPKE